jgi:hypothetical protein
MQKGNDKMAKTNHMIYVPAQTCSEEFNYQEWEECRKVNFERLKEIEEKAIANGGILYRFLYESVADGKAIYQIIKVNKRTVRVRLCSVDGCFDDYVVPQWGEEATINIEYAESGIKWQDAWRNRKF